MRPHSISPRQHDPGQGGFTVVELAVALFVVVEVILGVLLLFDFNNRLSRVQANVTDMQQSLRVAQNDSVRLLRMAGRGGLPAEAAVVVRNNVPDGTTVGGAGTPRAVAGTDVVTLRGAFSTPIYQVNAADPASFTLDDPANPAAATRGTVTIGRNTPTGIPQDFEPLLAAARAGVPEALLLVSPRDRSVYAVVRLDGLIEERPDRITVAFRTTGDPHSVAYRAFSAGGSFPATLTSAAFATLLEEYRLYVREQFAVPGDATSDLVSKLSLARTFLGLDLPHRDDPGNWSQDVADNIVDFQAALGYDTPAGGGFIGQDEDDLGDDDRIVEAADGRDDDWLYNSAEDVPGAGWAGAPLYYVRLSTLARTDRRDPQYQAPELVRVEDRAFAGSPFNLRTERMFRRRLLRTVVDMRNL